MLHLAPWLCWGIPVVGALLTPLLAKIHPKVRDYGAVLFSIIGFVFALSMVPDVLAGKVVDQFTGKTYNIPYESTVKWIPDFGIEMGVLVDPLSVFMANIASGLGALIMVYALGYMHGDPDLTRYWFFKNFFIGGMVLLVMANNLLQMFIGWEIVGMCSYALIGFWHKKKEPSPVPDYKTEGEYNAMCGMKAFITTRIGDVALLIAILIIYIFTLKAGEPTFNFLKLGEHIEWARLLAASGLLIPIIILLFGGPIGKSAQFPLHVWLPEAMAGPTTVSALIHAATMVKAGVYLVARILPIFTEVFITINFTDALYMFSMIVACIGAFTAFLAATMGMVAREVKKVLAYSTISQIGYMMLALGIGGLIGYIAGEVVEGYYAGTFHLMSHAVFKALLFLSAGAVLHATETKDMFEMGGLRQYMPITYKCMFIGALSLAGIPPLSGFWSKETIFHAAWILVHEAYDHGHVFIGAAGYVLLFLAVITAAITLFYSLRMIAIIFIWPESEYLKRRERMGEHAHEAPLVMWIPLAILATISLIGGIFAPMFEVFVFKGWEHVKLRTLEEIFIKPFFSPTFLMTLVAFGLGGIPAYYFYIGRKVDPTEFLERHRFLQAVHRFLYNRWYINDFYTKVIVGGFIKFSNGVNRFFELNIVDRFIYALAQTVQNFSEGLNKFFEQGVIEGFNYALARIAWSFSRIFRKTHTGDLNYNMIAVMLGVILLLLLLLFY